MKKKIIEVKIPNHYVDVHSILDEKTFDNAIKVIEYVKEHFKGRKVFFRVCPPEFEEGLDLQLWERREETDKEFKKRLDAEKKVKDQREKAKADLAKRERAQYLKLKQKFGGK